MVHITAQSDLSSYTIPLHCCAALHPLHSTGLQCEVYCTCHLTLHRPILLFYCSVVHCSALNCNAYYSAAVHSSAAVHCSAVQCLDIIDCWAVISQNCQSQTQQCNLAPAGGGGRGGGGGSRNSSKRIRKRLRTSAKKHHPSHL